MNDEKILPGSVTHSPDFQAVSPDEQWAKAMVRVTKDQARFLAEDLYHQRCKNNRNVTPNRSLIAPSCCIYCRAYWYAEMCALILEEKV